MKPKFAERRVLTRGVSDPQVQDVIDKVRAYLDRHLFDTNGDLAWWSEFERFLEGALAGLGEHQRVAVEIATDTMLVHSGVQSWSLARAWLEVARRQGEQGA
ncbi:hypothetical protein [Pseudoxanthomonas composti]|uniref:Uncharacterized protein n=1 Tax=Pseudoxanthomonas composti TaxID=2137479 RepID=A0A4Q1JR71_9GAMM|nr:hypothetical protein [Pseudoxanthomonas composti]RXQ99903.1 hypothetical protein EPA99_17415 [Pseudoxanthomonas composti]